MVSKVGLEFILDVKDEVGLSTRLVIALEIVLGEGEGEAGEIEGGLLF